jgi:hypothetical protein
MCNLNVNCARVGWASATTTVASEGFNKSLRPLFDHSEQKCPSCSKSNEPHITRKVSESRLLFQEATEWHSNVRNIVIHKVKIKVIVYDGKEVMIVRPHRSQWVVYTTENPQANLF